jgi:hypothetical protein|tara:strand:+ start:247 stop:1041 length:795 start_codon:yes stop_codon:yes gene_type:complete
MKDLENTTTLVSVAAADNHAIPELALVELKTAASAMGKGREAIFKASEQLATARVMVPMLDKDGTPKLNKNGTPKMKATDQYAAPWAMLVSPRQSVNNNNHLLSTVSQETYDRIKTVFIDGFTMSEKARLTTSKLSNKAGALVTGARKTAMRHQDKELYDNSGKGNLSKICLTDDGLYGIIEDVNKDDTDKPADEGAPTTPVAPSPIEFTKDIIDGLIAIRNSLATANGLVSDEQNVATDWVIEDVLTQVELALEVIDNPPAAT